MPRFRHKSSTPYGQHFLHDVNLLMQIVDTAELAGSEGVLEIGVGTGKLTERILDTGAKVTGVEVDTSLFAGIEKQFGTNEKFRLVTGDVLRVDWDDLLPADGKVVLMGNLPYAVSTQIIFKALDHRNRISRAVFLVQWEVGRRMASEPGSKDFGILALACQLYGRTSMIRKVPPGVFVPPPRVDSALVRWDILEEPVFPIPSRKFFMRVVKAAFGQRRKKMINSLSAGFGGLEKSRIAELVKELGLQETVRAEQVSLETFAALANRLYEMLGESSSDGETE
jgi:16S rRNA (adenine1518-N6/adenine1519-N6)-dimethyltransferase